MHIEINKEEEKEEWDEANYERNKQFEKFTTDTVAMKEKMISFSQGSRDG